MTIPYRWGAPIPPPGELRTYAICLENTWEGVLLGLLKQATRADYWQQTADPEDVADAQVKAERIVGTLFTPDCDCTPPCTPGSVLWDFTIDEQGWLAPGLGFYVAGVGWRAEVVDLTDGRHQQLTMTTAVGGRPTLLGIPRYEYRVWGFPGERCPIDIALYAFANDVPVIELQNVWNEAAHTTSLQVIGRAEWYAEAGGNTIDRIDIVVDVGPYNMALMTDVQFDIVRAYMEFCT